MKIYISISATELTAKDIKKALATRLKADILQAKVDAAETKIQALQKAKSTGYKDKVKALRDKNKELKLKHRDLLKTIPVSLRTRSAKQLTKQLETAEKKESKVKDKKPSKPKNIKVGSKTKLSSEPLPKPDEDALAIRQVKNYLRKIINDPYVQSYTYKHFLEILRGLPDSKDGLINPTRHYLKGLVLDLIQNKDLAPELAAQAKAWQKALDL